MRAGLNVALAHVAASHDPGSIPGVVNEFGQRAEQELVGRPGTQGDTNSLVKDLSGTNHSSEIQL